jgi:hypothetical protein
MAPGITGWVLTVGDILCTPLIPYLALPLQLVPLSAGMGGWDRYWPHTA